MLSLLWGLPWGHGINLLQIREETSFCQLYSNVSIPRALHNTELFYNVHSFFIITVKEQHCSLLFNDSKWSHSQDAGWRSGFLLANSFLISFGHLVLEDPSCTKPFSLFLVTFPPCLRNWTLPACGPLSFWLCPISFVKPPSLCCYLVPCRIRVRAPALRTGSLSSKPVIACSTTPAKVITSRGVQNFLLKGAIQTASNHSGSV